MCWFRQSSLTVYIGLLPYVAKKWPEGGLMSFEPEQSDKFLVSSFFSICSGELAVILVYVFGHVCTVNDGCCLSEKLQVIQVVLAPSL